MKNNSRKKVTIQDVAEYAGVSIATVSRVLNRQCCIREETRVQVLEAMKAVGYKFSNPSSNMLNSKLIIVVLPGIGNPFYSKIVSGIHASTKSHGIKYSIYICPDIDSSYDGLISFINFVNASGIILLSPVYSSKVLELIDTVAPVVQCAEYNESSDLPYVSIDDYSATRSAVEYMISKGKRRIALFNGPKNFKYSRYRLKGYSDALNEAGIPVNPNLIVHFSDVLFDPALSVASQLLDTRNRPDAIFCISDLFAAAVIKAADRLNISIPDDLGVVGFDNTYISTMISPSISVINQPQYELGYNASEMIIERIINPLTEFRHIILGTELIVRESL